MALLAFAAFEGAQVAAPAPLAATRVGVRAAVARLAASPGGPRERTGGDARARVALALPVEGRQAVATRAARAALIRGAAAERGAPPLDARARAICREGGARGAAGAAPGSLAAAGAVRHAAAGGADARAALLLPLAGAAGGALVPCYLADVQALAGAAPAFAGRAALAGELVRGRLFAEWDAGAASRLAGAYTPIGPPRLVTAVALRGHQRVERHLAPVSALPAGAHAAGPRLGAATIAGMAAGK